MKHILIIAFTLIGLLSLAGGLEVGDKAPDFMLENIDGKMVSLSDYEDAKGFIVVFTCNTCPYAVAYEDRLVELDKKYRKMGYPVVAIMPNDTDVKPGDSMEKMKERADEKGFTFPYLMDEGQKVYPKYGATKTPHVYLLQKEKKDLEVKYIGAIDDNYKSADLVSKKYVEDAIAALEMGKDPEISSTKAIGCSIKTK